jgi:hypothetical protein
MKFTEIVRLIVAATSLGCWAWSSPRVIGPLDVLDATALYQRLTWSRRCCHARNRPSSDRVTTVILALFNFASMLSIGSYVPMDSSCVSTTEHHSLLVHSRTFTEGRTPQPAESHQPSSAAISIICSRDEFAGYSKTGSYHFQRWKREDGFGEGWAPSSRESCAGGGAKVEIGGGTATVN